jgi:hypothetical protein
LQHLASKAHFVGGSSWFPLPAAGIENLFGADHCFRGQAVETPGRTTRFGVAFLGTASDPASILEAIEHAVYGRARSATALHERPAMQLLAIASSLHQQVQYIEQRLGYAYRVAHNAYITYVG